MNATELREALRAHFIAPNAHAVGQMFAPELVAPGSSRRADVVYLGLYESRGYGIDVCEIKVSRADFDREIADPSKADAWWPYSSRFWIVAPDTDVAPPERLPDGWGLMVPHAARNRRRFRVVVAPAERTPVVDFELLTRVVARAQTDADKTLAAERERLRAEHVEQVRRLVDSYDGRSHNAETQRRLDALDAFEAAAGVTLSSYSSPHGNAFDGRIAGHTFRRMLTDAVTLDREKRMAVRAANAAVLEARRLLAAAEAAAAATAGLAED